MEMKKLLSLLLVCVLAMAIALPGVSFATSVKASPFDNIPQREVNGEIYVPMRLTLEAFGTQVQWIAETQSVHFTFTNGNELLATLGELIEAINAFVENGVTWMPVETVAFFVQNTPRMIFTLTEEARDLVLYDFIIWYNLYWKIPLGTVYSNVHLT